MIKRKVEVKENNIKKTIKQRVKNFYDDNGKTYIKKFDTKRNDKESKFFSNKNDKVINNFTFNEKQNYC